MPDANGGRSCGRRLLRGVVCAGVLVVGGLTASPGVSPAEAADTLRGTDIEVPAPLPAPIRAESDPVVGAPGGGGESVSPGIPVVDPEDGAPSAGATVAPASPPGTASASDSGTGRTTSRPRSRTRATSAPAGDDGVPATDVLFAPTADDGDATVERLREATVPAARQFSLPLALGALVLAFFAVQGRVDRRDAKLMAAPITVADDLLPFA